MSYIELPPRSLVESLSMYETKSEGRMHQIIEGDPHSVARDAHMYVEREAVPFMGEWFSYPSLDPQPSLDRMRQVTTSPIIIDGATYTFFIRELGETMFAGLNLANRFSVGAFQDGDQTKKQQLYISTPVELRKQGQLVELESGLLDFKKTIDFLRPYFLEPGRSAQSLHLR